MSDDLSPPNPMDYLPDGRPQARALREQARTAGLHFEAYLPREMADWLLDLMSKGKSAVCSAATSIQHAQASSWTRYAAGLPT